MNKQNDFLGFHIRNASLHKLVFTIQNEFKRKYGPKSKAPYHFIFKYYLKLMFEHSDPIPFKNLVGYTIVEMCKEDKEAYEEFEQRMDSLGNQFNLGMEEKTAA